METFKLTCIECPKGCLVTVKKDGDKIMEISGNACPRGKIYAESEVTCPRRVLTTTVKVRGGGVLPVKTDKPIKKSEIFSVMKKINSRFAETPIKTGDVIIKNVTENINVVATDYRD